MAGMDTRFEEHCIEHFDWAQFILLDQRLPSNAFRQEQDFVLDSSIFVHNILFSIRIFRPLFSQENQLQRINDQEDENNNAALF
jgi:hypothetical protein